MHVDKAHAGVQLADQQAAIRNKQAQLVDVALHSGQAGVQWHGPACAKREPAGRR